MIVAALFDIHGNLPALERVLEDARLAAADAVVVGGDVLPGPMPRECLDRLSSLDVPVHFLYGNGEIAVLDQLAGRAVKVPDVYRPAIEFTASEVRNSAPAIAGWPLTVRLEIDGVGAVLFCHATPRNENDVFTRLTPAERLLPIFDAADADVVVCGHTHMQFDRRVGRTRVVNAGSVGMPFGAPGADWLLLGRDVQLQHTEYDLSAAAERIRRTAYPWPGDFAAEHILAVPGEQRMLAIYEPVSV
jgi:predicted phosphodiesterase